MPTKITDTTTNFSLTVNEIVYVYKKLHSAAIFVFYLTFRNVLNGKTGRK